MTKEESEKGYEDIVRYEPRPIMVIDKDETNQMLWDFNYSQIVRILRLGPMTLSEIISKFNNAAKDDENLQPKSDTTIYRYVKALEEIGLIAQAGRRVYFEKNATEILYCRTAHVFQDQPLPKTYWESERGRMLFERLYTAISNVYEGYEVDKKCLDEFILEFERVRGKQFEQTIPRLSKEELALIIGGDWWETDQTIRFTGIFGILLNRPDLVERLRNCFKKKDD